MMTSVSPNDPLLIIDGLTVAFETPLGRVIAAEDVNICLRERETLALVGETGCGKSVVASSILKLLPNNALVQGRIIYKERDLLVLSEKEISRIRCSEIAVIFQNPSLSLNPIIKIGEQIAEPLQVHKKAKHRQSSEAAKKMMNQLGLEDQGLIDMYPFQFSGGMNQRAMIATSMMLSPKIIIADEPTKGLDPSLSQEVVDQVAKATSLSGASLLLITHDLLLARKISDRIAVMYCGEIVEIGESERIFCEPLHPYTKALLDCLPERGFRPIAGNSPSMIHPPEGCKFHPRCPQSLAKCLLKPKMTAKEDGGEGRQVRCWLC
jgi:peptide/nickel transport system ATP-binding protein